MLSFYCFTAPMILIILFYYIIQYLKIYYIYIHMYMYVYIYIVYFYIIYKVDPLKSVLAINSIDINVHLSVI